MECEEGEALLQEGTNTRWVGALPSTSEPVHAGADEPCAKTPRKGVNALDTQAEGSMAASVRDGYGCVECRKTDLSPSTSLGGSWIITAGSERALAP